NCRDYLGRGIRDAAAVAAVEDPSNWIVIMVDIEAPAAQPFASAVPGADDALPELLKDKYCSPLHTRDRKRRRPAERSGGTPASAGHRRIQRLISVANHNHNHLGALNGPTIAISAVPCECVSLVRRARKGSHESLPGYRDFQIDRVKDCGQIGTAQRNI